MLITATGYQAKLLQCRGQKAVSFKRFCSRKLAEHKIEFLDEFAEFCLWREVIADVDYPNLEALIYACQDALKTLLQYEIPFTALDGFDQDGVVLFRSVLQRFQAKGQPTFYQALSQIKVTESVDLFGFVDLPPLYRRVFPNLHQLKESDEMMHPVTAKAPVLPARNATEEFLQALAEIERLWQADPSKTFALVVHQQELPWKLIRRLLNAYSGKLQINCSNTAVLAEQAKFLFLKDLFASRTATDLSVFSRVLVSPFWNEDQERRAQLDVSLRDHACKTANLSQVLKALVFHDQSLVEARWFQAWELLSRFELQSFETAVQLILDAAAFKHIELVQTDNKIDLHIVGSLEAAGLPVDAVWLLSADQDHYPAKISAPIFLPQVLLKQYHYPLESDSVRAFGQSLFAAITANKAVYASFVSTVQGEEKQLTEFIQAQVAESPLPFWESSSEAWVRVSKINHFPLQGEQGMVPGGTRVLKEQAECPFKAFAHFRLNVKALGEGRELLDPMQKGNLVHAVLEKIWAELKSQQNLLILNLEEREELVARKVDTVLFAQNPVQRQLIKQLERTRLIRLLLEWLNLEAKRPAFKVKACEAQELATLQGLQFKLRLDRIDSVEGGDVVIDYKTGNVSSNGWFDERLTEPQLPIYAVRNQAMGAVFASLKSGAMGYVGAVAGEALAFDKVKTIANWPAQLQDWRTKLEHLTAEFKQGRADVEPVDPKVCQYCDLTSFCRIKEKVQH